MLVFRSVGCCILFLVSFFYKGKDQKLYTIHGFAQGTSYNISYYAASAQASKHEIDSILVKIDSSMSLYKPYSLIHQFNRSLNGIRIDNGFASVVKKSFEIYNETDGRFDITVAPLVQLWGFGPVPVQTFPDSLTVREALRDVGMKQLNLRGNALRKMNPRVQIDLNGIAQGYSVDVVASFLRAKGIKSFMVEIGGEVLVHGRKPDGSGYKIGIEGPVSAIEEQGRQTAQPFRHIVQINEGAVTTSGNYTKILKYKQEKISHLINAKTGYPLINQMISVTIYAKDAITADGYDNALMAMDISEAMAFIAKKKNLEAYIIYRKPDGHHADTLTSGFKKLLVN